MKKIFGAIYSQQRLLGLAISLVGGLAVKATNAAESLPGISSSATQNVRSFTMNVICQIGAWMFWILISLSVVIVLVAAYEYLTSSGNPEKVNQASKRIAFAAVAIVVALIAKGFPLIIVTIFPSVTGINASTTVCP